jgi:hypothetical protein
VAETDDARAEHEDGCWLERMRSSRHVDLNPKGKRNRPTSQEDRSLAADNVMELGRAIAEQAAGLDHVRFHDGRHTARTRLTVTVISRWR